MFGSTAGASEMNGLQCQTNHNRHVGSKGQLPGLPNNHSVKPPFRNPALLEFPWREWFGLHFLPSLLRRPLQLIEAQTSAAGMFVKSAKNLMDPPDPLGLWERLVVFCRFRVDTHTILSSAAFTAMPN
jgi:hypothetical protein